jgi:hypothetical protein
MFEEIKSECFSKIKKNITSNLLFSYDIVSVADPHHVDADPYPDPTFFTFIRIRILLFTLILIQILPFTLIRIRISPPSQNYPDPQH